MRDIIQTAIATILSNPDPSSDCNPETGFCIDNVKVTMADCWKAAYGSNGNILALTPCHSLPSCCVARYRICRQTSGQITIFSGSISTPPNPTCTGTASPFPSTDCTPVCQFMDFGM